VLYRVKAPEEKWTKKKKKERKKERKGNQIDNE